MKRTGAVMGVALLAISGALATRVGVPTTSAQTPPAPAPGATTASAAPVRVGFVDIQRVLARSSAGVAAREQLEKEKAAMQRQVDGQRGEIEKLRDELEKKGQLLSAEARREKQELLERKVRDARRLVDDLQGTLQKKEEALLAKVLQDVSGLIQRVSKERGFGLVLERQRSSVLYATPESDLTDDVLRAYDDETKKGAAKK
jgi:outer membrane protein